MNDLQKRFQNFVEEQHLINKGERILLAVSGGVDSMTMANLFLKSKFSFGIAHCHFGLRGIESDKDEEFVRKWAKKNQIKGHFQRWNLDKEAVQLNARKARYRWFNELCDVYGYAKIAAAHHLDDSMETLLINLTRGTGIRGLSGIPLKSDRIIRPLLRLSKEDIKCYASQHHLTWREDASNAKIDYSRNLIRSEVIPQLAMLNPSLSKTFRNTIERLQWTNDLVQKKVEEIKNHHLETGKTTLKLHLSWYHHESDIIILSEILAVYGFNFSTVKEMVKCLNHPGKIFLAAHWKIIIDRDMLFITARQKECAFHLTINNVGSYTLNEGRLVVELKKMKEVSFDKNPNVALMDADIISFPLDLRTWKLGDHFQPLGMHGHKKVSDFLTDLKVPLMFKNKQLVLVNKQKTITWLVGRRIAEPYKLTEKTNRVLIFRRLVKA